MALRRIPIRRISISENLFMGGDRELIMFSGLLIFVMVFYSQSFTAAFFGIILWSFTLYIFRLMAKADPKMRWVYIRHRKYKKYYPARSTPYRINTAGQGRRYK